MDVHTFCNEMVSYLPLDFDDENNNAYKKYLLDALIENWEKQKYQFCILASNMLFMSCLYKECWFLLDKHIPKVDSLVNKYANFGVSKPFELSVIPEKTFLDQFMSIFDLHANRKSEAKRLIEVRDECAHASGEIQYEQADVESKFQEYLKVLSTIFEKQKKHIENAFINATEKYFTDDSVFDNGSDFQFLEQFCRAQKLSQKDLQVLVTDSVFSNIKTDMMDSREEICSRKLSLILLRYYISQKISDTLGLQYLTNEICKLVTEFYEQKDNIIMYIENENIYNQHAISDYDTSILFDKINSVAGTDTIAVVGINLYELATKEDENE